MKLAKGTDRLWIGERRGTAVFIRAGKVGAPGVPKAREHKTEATAQSFLEAERDKRLAEGFIMLDEAAGLDAPFTFDGKAPTKTKQELPGRYAHLQETVLMHVRAGYRDDDEIGTMIEELVRDERIALRREAADRAGTAGPARIDEPPLGASSKLEDALREIARDERRALRNRKRPEPWVNAAIDRAFDALDREGIIALQAAGFTQSDGWADANEIVARRRASGATPRGATFFHEQDLERALQGRGLMLTFGAYAGDDAEIAAAVVTALRAEGVDATWNGDPKQRIHIAPFEWFRLPR